MQKKLLSIGLLATMVITNIQASEGSLTSHSTLLQQAFSLTGFCEAETKFSTKGNQKEAFNLNQTYTILSIPVPAMRTLSNFYQAAMNDDESIKTMARWNTLNSGIQLTVLLGLYLTKDKWGEALLEKITPFLTKK